ncbi:MAG: hypothetical protein IKQ16_01920 [Lentisphaeria bacterium]|jgi:hypothetical protein|nr:hypothetical protein [Lentisphaeria bacterium]
MKQPDDKNDMKYLVELLDDENEQSASMAMAELLTKGSTALEPVLRDMQKSDNPRLRKRTRQLQHALIARSRRRIFMQPPERPISLLTGLIRLHLCWFDNDKQSFVEKQWRELEAAYRKARPVGLAGMADFMRKTFPDRPENRDFHPDSFCIGAVLEDKIGSDMIFACIAAILSSSTQNRFSVVRVGVDTAVADKSGCLIFPVDNWQLYGGVAEDEEPPVVWDTQTILRYVSSVLFVSAVASDGFRYLYTLGAPLAAAIGEKDLSFLPYPYGNGSGETAPSDGSKS